MDYPNATAATQEALANLRSPDLFAWYLIPFLAFVIYVYFSEIERKNWNVVLAGLAFYGLEFFLELLNALFFHFNGYAPCWLAPADSAYLITIGLNIEICMMFAVAGVVFAKVLPADRSMKIWGIPNRVFLPLLNAAFCVVVEIILNAWNALIWEYWWWSARFPLLIFVIGYSLYMFFSTWVHDMDSRKKQLTVVGIMWGIDVVGYGLFMGILGWV